jgi:phosphoenolpyruvate synthase/pyruvate phosphate dikinase
LAEEIPVLFKELAVLPSAAGKAWNLARLAGYGFTVSAGVAIVVEGYRQWLADSGLEFF